MKKNLDRYFELEERVLANTISSVENSSMGDFK
jgi:hypothetical protein